MRIPFQSSLSRLSHTLREMARNRPEEAEEFLDSHQDEWEEIAETDPGSAADILEALPRRTLPTCCAISTQMTLPTSWTRCGHRPPPTSSRR